MFGSKRRFDMSLFQPVPAGYLVGGAVRDSLLKRDVSDLDWLVAEPEMVARRCCKYPRWLSFSTG